MPQKKKRFYKGDDLTKKKKDRKQTCSKYEKWERNRKDCKKKKK